MEKKLYDMRGSQANIFRLAKFDTEGFIHMLFFRILIFVSVIYGLAIMLYFENALPGLWVKLLTAIVWILITPQFFQTVKVISMVGSGGLSFSHFSQEYVFLAKEKRQTDTRAFDILPYALMAIWVIFFIAMLVWWNI